MAEVTYSNEDINRFWLKDMGDMALILLNAVSPANTEDVRRARALADRFDALAVRADQDSTPDQTTQINRDAVPATLDLQKFILDIMKKYVTSNYYLDLKPQVLTNFLKSTDKYLGLLNTFIQNKAPLFDTASEEVFWLPIFLQQSYYISNNVGYFQKEYRERAQEFSDIFNDEVSFSQELQGLYRIGKRDFPVAIQHHEAVINTLRDYYEFLTSLTGQAEERRIPGPMSLLYLDRARRMACYFLRQMAVFLDEQPLDCDPYAQRISSL